VAGLGGGYNWFNMTRLMEQAIERLRAVPETQQDELARFLLSELDEDARWAASTGANLERLRRLGERVLADDARGACEPLDPAAFPATPPGVQRI
jgi:hypothetical protein